MKQKESPFIFGNTVSKSAFTNREKERKQLKSDLLSGNNAMLISPRRWGKSSLVEKVFQEIKEENKNVKCVLIDLFSTNTQEEFFELFAKEIIKSTSNKWEDWVKFGKESFNHLIPSISFGVDPMTDFKINFNWEELKKNPQEILELPEKIAKQKKIKIIIGIDEFQNLSEFNNFEALEKKMRSVWQRQKNTSYCLFGSKRQMMAEIFTNSKKPFYKFGDLIYLRKIEKKYWIPFIQSGFENTGKKIEETETSRIVDLMRNQPWYVQQLSHYTWNHTNKTANSKTIDTALLELMNTTSPFFEREIELMSKTQVNLLSAVIQGEEKFTSKKVMDKYRLGTPRNVSKNKQILIEKDIIEKFESAFKLLDPAFELWFKIYYLKTLRI